MAGNNKEDRHMAPDEFQKAWRTHLSETRVTVDADLLRKEVQLEQQNFRSRILARDSGEVGVALVMIPLWFVMGAALSLPWTWYLTVPVMIWLAGFMLVYRKRHKQPPSQPDDSLAVCVQRSLTEQEDQIWMLRNVFWWYLLPPTISILAFFAQTSWQLRSAGWPEALMFFVLLASFLFAIYGFVYYINRRAVRVQLEPKRDALLALLTSLTEESASGGAKTVSVSVASLAETKAPAPPVKYLKTRLAIVLIGFVAIMGLGVWGIAFMADMKSDRATSGVSPETLASILTDERFRTSPFEAVQWQDSLPEVRLNEEWFRLVSLDDIPAAEIVSFSRRTYGEQWHKRFEEDLVEILTGMKHPLGATVTLVVQSLSSSETEVRDDVLMTHANREAIRKAARTRESSETQLQAEAEEQPQEDRKRVMRAAVSIDNTEQFRDRVDEFLRLAQVNAGFSGIVLVAKGGEPIYEGTCGFSHLDSKTPNSLDTPFRIAALSQTFTAAAIFSLEADGALSVDDPVYRYFPEFEAEEYRAITIYHLLTHSSGLPRVPEDAAGQTRFIEMMNAPTPVNDYVGIACECPLKFEPGEERLYTNIGYRVLSAIIALVTGEEYADFMQRRVFEPLDLKQTGVARISQPANEGIVAETVSRLSLGSRTHGPSFVNSDSGQNYGAEYGNGGVYSSAYDLLRWDRALAGDRFLTREQKVKMFRPFKGDYACGWIVQGSDPERHAYQMYIGGNFGYFSQVMRIPDDDLAIIALGNSRLTDDIREALRQLFLLCRSLPYQAP